MTPSKFDFKPQYKGNTFKGVHLTFSIEDNGVTTPMDLTGVDIRMEFKTSLNATSVKTFIKNSGITIIDDKEGIIQIDEFLVTLPVAKYLYDLKLTFPDGTVTTYLTGNFDVKQNLL